MTKSKLNLELFKQVRDKILSAPTAYDQSIDRRDCDEAPCGTACCIGGWADVLSAPNKSEQLRRMQEGVNLDRAANALGLDGEDFWCEMGRETERSMLFDADPQKYWPQPFARRWRNAKTPAERAQVAADYIDKIIETGKVRL